MVNLIILVMFAFDVILGMDWLLTYHVKINYFPKTVCLRIYGRAKLIVATS